MSNVNELHVTKHPVLATFSADRLGSAEFKKDYKIRYAYLAGAMAKAIGSKELVVRMGKAGLMGYYGTGGVRLSEIEKAIQYIQTELSGQGAYGFNLLNNINNSQEEMDTVDLFLKYGVENIEASAYMKMSLALVKFRLTGLSVDQSGQLVIKNKILAKVSRPEIADQFLRPANEKLVEQLLIEGVITQQQSDLSKKVAMSDDICVEADSGGHTDMANLTVLLPAIKSLRDRVCEQYQYTRRVRVGAAGGIGTPESALSAFILGAEFILTGSINQCTVEAGNSDQVKEMLALLNVQDTDYAPAGDMFEIGAKAQVMKKGVFFPSRANKLHELWRNHSCWEEIDLKTRNQIESKYFRRSFESVYAETKDYYFHKSPQQIDKAEKNPHHKMALVFRWYFIYSMRLAMNGDSTDRTNYQVHTGPAIGAFNQWVKGTALEDWKNRHVDEIAELIMRSTAELLKERFNQYLAN